MVLRKLLASSSFAIAGTLRHLIRRLEAQAQGPHDQPEGITMRDHFLLSLHRLTICSAIALLFSTQAVGATVEIDGVLDEGIYKAAPPLESAIGVLYLVPTSEVLYIGAEVEDANINVGNPQKFWLGSGIEIWFDWGNEDNVTFDENDQQFWVVPVEGEGDAGYSGQWHRAADNIRETMYDYANESDLLDMAFILDEGTGYTIEASIAAEAMEGYDPNATIGFTYSVDKGGAKFQWDKEILADPFWERPDMWPDLALAQVELSVEPQEKLPVLWGRMKLGR